MGFNACLHENHDHRPQWFFQPKKHSAPGSLSPFKLCLPLKHELKGNATVRWQDDMNVEHALNEEMCSHPLEDAKRPCICVRAVLEE